MHWQKLHDMPMHLVEKLQDPLVKFICAWHRFVTKKSFEETVQLGESESGELKRCLRLCELFSCVLPHVYAASRCHQELARA